MDNLNLNSLRVFAMAARHGSFQRAAEMLNITHGAVSQRIKHLEVALGVTLFERGPRGVDLTTSGAAYHARVEEALDILDTATRDLRRGEGQVMLHLGASFASKWLMPRIQDFTARHPGISLRTEVHDMPLDRALGRNEIAIWPARGPVRRPGAHVRRLCALDLVAVCSPGFPGPDRPVDTETLLQFPLLQDANRRWERLITAAGQGGGHNILNFDRSALALDAAIQGHGVAMAPTYMTGPDVTAGRLVVIWAGPEPTGESLYLAWPGMHAPHPALRRTVSWILSEFGLDPEAQDAAPSASGPAPGLSSG